MAIWERRKAEPLINKAELPSRDEDEEEQKVVEEGRERGRFVPGVVFPTTRQVPDV